MLKKRPIEYNTVNSYNAAKFLIHTWSTWIIYLDNANRVNKEIKEAEDTSEWTHRHNDDETEFWGYIDVRPGAHMFYWLYHSSHPDGYLQRPLIIWLQVRHIIMSHSCDKDDDNEHEHNICYHFDKYSSIIL